MISEKDAGRLHRAIRKLVEAEVANSWSGSLESEAERLALDVDVREARARVVNIISYLKENHAKS